jgi:hypothetical protein
MNFGFRSEVGYDAAKDVTFLRTNTPDFADQLVFPVARGSKEDKEIRTLLEDQGIVDFTAVNAPVYLPAAGKEMSFGMVGNEEDDTLTPENYDSLVLFGKDGSGALNLIRFWLLWAKENDVEVVAVGTPSNLYGSGPHMDVERIHFLDADGDLRQQYGDISFRNQGFGADGILFLVGADFETETLEDRLFLKEVQSGVLEGEEVFSLIHRANPVLMSDMPFTGSDGDKDKVSFAVIGDTNDITAKLVGSEVPTRNARGIGWFSLNDAEAQRVKTYLVPRDLVGQNAPAVTAHIWF